MIDGSKTRKSLAGVEVQSPYGIERRSKDDPVVYVTGVSNTPKSVPADKVEKTRRNRVFKPTSGSLKIG